MMNSPIDGTPLITRNIIAGPGWNSVAPGFPGICETCMTDVFVLGSSEYVELSWRYFMPNPIA